LAGLTYADYDAELREATVRNDGIRHVDTPRLIQKLLAGNIKTYAYLVWHQPTDWDDFRLEFLPAAQAAQLKVWLYLTPPSENTGLTNGYVPFGSNYVNWATETAKLAQQYPVLQALALDDFNGNEAFFTPGYVSNMMAAAHAWCSNLLFVPVNYDLSHSSSNPTKVISPAFAINYGPYCGGVIFPYLNWTNKDDVSDEAAQIANNSAILSGQRAQFLTAFPANLRSTAGDAATLTQTLTNAAGFPNAPFPFQFRLSDDYNGPTTNYHKLQVLVDSSVVWEGDTGGATGIQDINLNLQAQLQGKTAAVLSARMYDAKGVYNYPVTVSWNLPPGNWTLSQSGAFVGTSTYYPAPLGLNLPLVVMIYDGGYGSGTNRWVPGTNYLYQANTIAQAAVMSGDAAGIIQYCLNKADTSPQFPLVQQLYGLFQSVVGVGNNTAGQLNVPPGTTNVVAVAAGAAHTLALRADGAVLAWGSNSAGQCNVPSTASNVLAIAAGAYHSLALRAKGTVLAWGSNTFRQSNVPLDLTGVAGIAAGTRHSVALRADGTVTAWGDNSFGQTNLPAGLSNAVAITAGGNHTLALRADGTVLAWGENTDANGNLAGQSQVPAVLTNAVAIGAGDYHSLAVRTDGTVVAWGDNSQGQCQVPPGLSHVVAVAGGAAHSLALTAEGALVAWGSDLQGQCDFPADLTPAAGIAAGASHSVVLLAGSGPLPRLLNPAWHAGQFTALAQTLSRQHYGLEFRDAWTNATWIGLPAVPGNGALRILTDSSATNGQRFYRLRQW
jgi:alpha-tubulin suppressor-like RCC1 family protein